MATAGALVRPGTRAGPAFIDSLPRIQQMSDTHNRSTSGLPAHAHLVAAWPAGLVFERRAFLYPMGYAPKLHKQNAFGANR